MPGSKVVGPPLPAVLEVVFVGVAVPDVTLVLSSVLVVVVVAFSLVFFTSTL